VTNGSYQIGTLLDPTWSVAAVFLVAAAWRPPSRTVNSRKQGWAVLVIPTLFIVAAVGLLATFHHGTGPDPVTILATATVLAGLVRAAFTYHEMQTLVINGVEARTDELTGLGNRRAFVEAVERRTNDGRGRFSVMLLDLDRFKEVNDSLGHLAGDQLLREVGLRLRARMREGDVLARLGGDEFAILLDNASPELARDIGERLRLDLQHAFVSDGVMIYSDASCGVAAWPEAAGSVGGLLQRADIAMYEAKRERLGTAIYAHANEADLSAPLRLVEELRAAFAENQLVLYFQPKLDLQTANLQGVEALVRWQHPLRGLLAPDEFLPQAERYGLMRRLTDCVLAIALDQIADWQRTGLDTTVAVNISASNLLDLGLPDQIRTLLTVHNLKPSCLTLEVTETTLMVDPMRATELLARLQAVGVRVSIDDYGTGYSSLARLRELPVNELKLDRSFLTGIGSDPRATAIVRSTVELAHSLGLTLVAEGIETEQDRTILRDLSCDLGQGYHLARPMPGHDLLNWAASHGTVADHASLGPH
jgi:diguanylate cyclase